MLILLKTLLYFKSGKGLVIEMELISKEDFSQLEWYTINIYIKGEPKIDFASRILRKEYYETLHYIVKPFVEENENWIKCFYYTQYFDEKTPYQIKIRIGTKETLQNIEEKLDEFFQKLLKDKLDLLDEKTHDIEKMKELTHDKNRFARIEEGKFDEDAYYWFVMHWQTGSIYFLEILENGYDNFPDLAGVPHLQWNLMGLILPHPQKDIVIPETEAMFHTQKGKGIAFLNTFGKYNLDYNNRITKS